MRIGKRLSGIPKTLLFPAIIILALPLTVLLTQQVQDLQQKASELPTTEDPQTHEMYDIQITSDVELVKNTAPGPFYSTKTVFSIGGSKVNRITTLYGFQERTVSKNQQFSFTYIPDSFPRFKSEIVNLDDESCIDLNSQPTNTREGYIATFCYDNFYISPKSNGRAYSVNHDPSISFYYNGDKQTVIQTLSTAHDRYKYPNPSGWGLNNFHRVSYFTFEPRNSDYQNVKYEIGAILYGLNEAQYGRWLDPNVKKYIKQSWGVKPQGGSNYEVDRHGGLTYEYTSNRILPAFVSLDIEGGLPSPVPSISPSPSMNPSSSPRPNIKSKPRTSPRITPKPRFPQ